MSLTKNIYEPLIYIDGSKQYLYNSDLIDKIIKSDKLKMPTIGFTKLIKVKTVPYKHNYGYFFTSGPNSWHGMEKKEIKKERRCIQINYVTFETDWKVK